MHNVREALNVLVDYTEADLYLLDFLYQMALEGKDFGQMMQTVKSLLVEGGSA